jgi:hypothetical protein
MRQLMCTAVSQLSSDQLVPLHHHAHFIYPACLFFLILLAIRQPQPSLILLAMCSAALACGIVGKCATSNETLDEGQHSSVGWVGLMKTQECD